MISVVVFFLAFKDQNFIKTLPGVTKPFSNVFDPAGFTTNKSEGRIRFYREAELKHGRVAMLAAVGFPLAEQYHPLFGGKIDVPSYVAFQQTPLQTFWPAVVLFIAIFEVFSAATFQSPFGNEPWTIDEKHNPGDFGFDPLNIGPSDKTAYEIMQEKELNNGRTAMLGIVGMVAQELVVGSKIFSGLW